MKTEMGKADQLDGPRKGSVGFALTALQRRLASSPEAIFQSLKRRRERLERRLREEKLGARGQQILAETLARCPGGRRRPERRGAGEAGRNARRSGHRRRDHRRARSRDRHPPGPRTAGQGRGRLRPGPQVGRTLEASSRTIPRCTTPAAASARSSSSPSTATR